MLQSRKYISSDYISEKFGISVRTVYRDLKALTEIGIPVSFEINKGYFVVQGYFLSPVSFTDDEANALIFMETIAKRFGDKSIQDNYESALNKIKATLKDFQKEKVEDLSSKTHILSYPSPPKDFKFLSEILKSITNKAILKIDYQDNKKNISTREVEPIAIKYYSLDWHMIAWCWKRNNYRDFKASHILQLSNTGIPFRKNKHISLTDYMKSLETKIFLKGLP
jgi:predicted DNA-binding transcriptional regulator YafY